MAAWAINGVNLPQYARSRRLGRAVGFEVRRALGVWYSKTTEAVTG